MAFKPGHKKLGGRKPGTPNKKSQAVQDILEAALGKSVPEAVCELLDDLKPKDRVQALLELMSYVYPKRKAIELSGRDGGPLDVYLMMSPEERARRMRELADMLVQAEKQGSGQN